MNKKEENIVVIGLGPTGLAAALEACSNDREERHVIALTNRTEYNRGYIVTLDEDIFPYLESLVGSKIIKEYIEAGKIGPLESIRGHNFRTIQIKTLENLLYNELLKYKNVEIIYLDRAACKDIHVNKDSNTISIKTQDVPRIIPFKYLIAADGAHHNIASDAINDKSLQYDDTQRPVVTKKHARVTYKLPSASLLATNLSEGPTQGPIPQSDYYRAWLKQSSNNKPTINELKKMGWEFFSVPEARIFIADDLLYVGTECPHSICGNKGNDIIDQWIKTVLRYYLPENAISILQRIDSDCATFDVELEEANRTVLPLLSKTNDLEKPVSSLNEAFDDRTSFFFQLGDALRRPHYHTGSGAVTGLVESKVLGEFLASNQIPEDICRYHAEVAAIRFENRAKVDELLEKRAAREAKEKSEYFVGTLLANSMQGVIGSRKESIKPAEFTDLDNQPKFKL